MRIVIFDGILEAHLASSLARALQRRGHVVLNTGKIGSGFEFPRHGADTGLVEAWVERVKGWRPDVILVMRPASLPIRFLARLKSTGAALIAWFSDDPVLFDLSYGPIVAEYDIILHCGNERVLSFYEGVFGYATGINFPFWTDHDSFPAVWGESKPQFDFVFLGNLHDDVRRKRYFDLGRSSSSIRVYGNAGVDYFGISGGYLDSNREVVAACAETHAAISIPQFFSDHHGLPTWFDGLDELGFFEFPSRVVQYMAMGLPTISIIPALPSFPTYPEMVVLGSVEELDEFARSPRFTEELEVWSDRTVARFDLSFSANARAIALEAVLSSDDWRSLDVHERALWFSQFDGSESDSTSDPAVGLSFPGEPVALNQSCDFVTSPEDDSQGEPTFGLVAGEGELDRLTVVVAGEGWTRPTSRVNVISDLLRRSGVEVVICNGVLIPSLFVLERGIGQKMALGVGALIRSGILSGADALVVAGVACSLSDADAEALRERGITVVLIGDDLPDSHEAVLRAAESFDIVTVSRLKTYKEVSGRGCPNVLYLPYLVAPSFLELANAGQDRAPQMGVLGIRSSAAQEEAQCPTLAWDAADALNGAHADVAELERLSVEDLFAALNVGVVTVSYGGTRARPQIPEMIAYAAVAAGVCFVERTADRDDLFPFADSCVEVMELGEILAKASLLARSPRLLSSLEEGRERLLAVGRRSWMTFRRQLEARRAGGDLVRRSSSLSSGTFIEVPRVDGLSGVSRQAHVVSLEPGHLPGNRDDWTVVVYVKGIEFGRARARQTVRLLLSATCSDRDVVVFLRYGGADLHVDKSVVQVGRCSVEGSELAMKGHQRGLFPLLQ